MCLWHLPAELLVGAGMLLDKHFTVPGLQVRTADKAGHVLPVRCQWRAVGAGARAVRHDHARAVGVRVADALRMLDARRVTGKQKIYIYKKERK